MDSSCLAVDQARRCWYRQPHNTTPPKNTTKTNQTKGRHPSTPPLIIAPSLVRAGSTSCNMLLHNGSGAGNRLEASKKAGKGSDERQGDAGGTGAAAGRECPAQNQGQRRDKPQ